MRTRRRDDQRAGPRPEDLPAGENSPDGELVPEDSAESEGEKLAKEIERGLDRGLTRIPPG
jgi:hypothetical protein